MLKLTHEIGRRILTIRLFKELSLLRRIKSKFIKIKTAQNFERFIFYISLSA